MVFNASVTSRGANAVIRLTGDLDATSATDFISKVNAAVLGGAERVLLDMTELHTLSSAGLRGLIFAVEKMPNEVDVVLVAPNPVVRDVIDDVGFEQSVEITDVMPE